MRPRGHASPRQFFSNIKTTQMVNRCPLPLSLNYSIFGLLSEPVDPFYCGWGYTATWVQLKTVSQCRLHARSQVIIVEIWDSSLFCFSGFAQLFFQFSSFLIGYKILPFLPFWTLLHPLRLLMVPLSRPGTSSCDGRWFLILPAVLVSQSLPKSSRLNTPKHSTPVFFHSN